MREETVAFENEPPQNRVAACVLLKIGTQSSSKQIFAPNSTTNSGLASIAGMAENTGEITLLLRRWRDGDKDAESQLFELLSPELRKIAGCCFRGERANHTLQPTAILNEAFLRLAAIRNNRAAGSRAFPRARSSRDAPSADRLRTLGAGPARRLSEAQ